MPRLYGQRPSGCICFGRPLHPGRFFAVCLGEEDLIMLDLDLFVADCRAALTQDASHKFVREVVARAVSGPGAVLQALGVPQRAEMQILHRSSDLTILNVIWAPWMTLLPHNHQMWAVIGIYTGREDNIFWRRVPCGEHG